MELEEKLSHFEHEMYFFILKRVKNENFAKDILQNVYLKALENSNQIKDSNKTRAWLYQIARNEVNDFFKQQSKFNASGVDFNGYIAENDSRVPSDEDLCCFDKFINELPDIYKAVIKQIFLKGKTQKETAAALKITLANVKIRVSRAKEILKNRLKECCHYRMDANGKLTGTPNCERCNSVVR